MLYELNELDIGNLRKYYLYSVIGSKRLDTMKSLQKVYEFRVLKYMFKHGKIGVLTPICAVDMKATQKLVPLSYNINIPYVKGRLKADPTKTFTHLCIFYKRQHAQDYIDAFFAPRVEAPLPPFIQGLFSSKTKQDEQVPPSLPPT